MSEELKPCPFCGGKAYFERHGTPRQSCIIECGSCGCRLESSEEGSRCGSMWNRRAEQGRSVNAQPQQATGEAAVLAKVQREPVAWRWKERINDEFDSGWRLTSFEPPTGLRTIAIEPLYNHHAQPRKRTEQDAWEDWAAKVCPSGDVDEVQRQWLESTEQADFMDEAAQPQQAAQAEPVAWGQLGTLNGKTYLRMAYDRTPYPPPADVVRNLNLVPLYAAAQPQQAATTNDLTELDHVMCLCQDCNRRSMDAERFRWLTEDHGDPETRAKCRELLGRMGVMSYSAACGAINRAIADDLKRSMLRTADQWRAAQPQQATGGET